jgi:chromosome segregation ATPase
VSSEKASAEIPELRQDTRLAVLERDVMHLIESDARLERNIEAMRGDHRLLREKIDDQGAALTARMDKVQDSLSSKIADLDHKTDSLVNQVVSFTASLEGTRKEAAKWGAIVVGTVTVIAGITAILQSGILGSAGA